MKTTRRNFIVQLSSWLVVMTTCAGNILKSVAAFADWNVDAFSSETKAGALAALFPEIKTISPSDAITISVHDVVENGAVVPIKVATSLPSPESITIMVEKNPNPLIAKFNMTPVCVGTVSTRIKVAEPSMIIAIVKSDGQLFTAQRMVEVVEGGCG